jgi:hypothetical protein
MIVITRSVTIGFDESGEWQVRLARDATPARTCCAAAKLSAEVFFWDDFHERYLIADVIGISVPAGFDVTSKPEEFSTWGRLGRADKDKIQRMFDPAATGKPKVAFRDRN